jgi:predicted CopG family antitoxin
MHEKYARNARHTITISDLAFSRLRGKGEFGESYSDVILRVLDAMERMKEAS